MPRSLSTTAPKTKEELLKEVRPGDVRLEKDTKVIALDLGYSDCLREPGDVFWVKKGTIYRPGYTWFEPVDKDTATKEDAAKYADMEIPALKIALAKAGVKFKASATKDDLIALLIKENSDEDEELA